MSELDLHSKSDDELLARIAELRRENRLIDQDVRSMAAELCRRDIVVPGLMPVLLVDLPEDHPLRSRAGP